MSSYIYGNNDTEKDLLQIPHFKTLAEAKENIVPFVPDDVSEFCRFIKIFKDDKTILDLRPMIYSYWS
jgi:hypothetical protein